MSNITEIFNNIEKQFSQDQLIKEKVWAIVSKLNAGTREILQVIQIIHQTSDKTIVAENIAKSKGILKSVVQPAYGEIEEILTPISIQPFNQYHDQWRNVTQKLSFLAALIIYLEDNSLALHDNVADLLNMKKLNESGLVLDLEDYLVGLLMLANELSRFAVNSVTHGDYQRPVEISKFVADLAGGFRLLTFKNDFLRKRYDSLKYDVKQIEEVVYDLSIRGISNK